jgi:DNA invertase Pin-like site-specific DNA recombinase|tara:strand:+ start:206 stop:916 length:711 start_codon:yes stop_codon:yes gene_type:complete
MSTKCVSYFRTSSSTNTGDDKDSLKRQKYVVSRFCNNNGYEIESEFYETLRGDGEILSRPKFMEMMEFCDSNDIKTIVFENTTRFSRDLICSENGYVYLKGLGFTLISSESPESFVDDTPTSVLIRRVLSCLSDFEKNSIVEKLRGSRLRKRSVMKEKGVITRQGKGRVEGRKTLIETHPELEVLVKNYSKTMNNSKISQILESEHGLKIHRTSIPNIIKDIELRKKEERNRKRRK